MSGEKISNTGQALAKIVIYRESAFADRWRAYRIDVNGKTIGKLRRNSQLSADVPPGVVDIGARIDWCRAHPLELDTQPGETAWVLVANTFGARKAGYAIIAGMDEYLTLIQTDGPS